MLISHALLTDAVKPAIPCARKRSATRTNPSILFKSRSDRTSFTVHAESTDTAARSSYKQSSGVVKGLVGGLTAAVNALSSVSSTAQQSAAAQSSNLQTRHLTTQELLAGIRDDFTQNGYLWTGEITEQLYDPDCTFTDPTLSFKGTDVFKRNIANLKPILDWLLLTREVDLRECFLDEPHNRVVARWRMAGDLKLPWKPRIELTGQTAFTYADSSGGRIVSYDESWDITPAAALLQIVTPRTARHGSTH